MASAVLSGITSIKRRLSLLPSLNKDPNSSNGGKISYNLTLSIRMRDSQLDVLYFIACFELSVVLTQIPCMTDCKRPNKPPE